MVKSVFLGALRLFLTAGPLLCLFFLLGCATHKGASASLNHWIAQEDYNRAASLLEKSERQYGSRNKLLYFLDKGFVLHLAQEYQKSNAVFEEAKKEYDRLYTKSITEFLGSLAFNDYVLTYSGEDFERVLINIFKALGYFLLNDLESALVEAKNVDETLRMFQSRHGWEKTHVYREDAFARLLMGIFYEASRTSEGYNNAFISYAQAARTYTDDYLPHYQVPIPDFLKENLFASAQFMGKEELEQCRARYGNIAFDSFSEKAKKAQVYLVQYNGPSPTKAQIFVPVTFLNGQIVTLALPRYERLRPRITSSIFSAQENQTTTLQAQSQTVQDINAIATKSMETKRAGIIAKALTSSASRYFTQRALRDVVKKELGKTAEQDFLLLSNLFHLYTGRADLRSWQTLPYEIRMARLLLDPGEYHFTVDHYGAIGQVIGRTDLGIVNVSAGEIRFLIVRSSL